MITMRRKLAVVYCISDGREFTNQEEAIKEELNLSIRLYVGSRGMGRGGCWSEDMIANQLIEDIDLLRNILTENPTVREES